MPASPSTSASRRCGLANLPEEEFEDALQSERPATVTQLAERGIQPPHGVDEERPAKLRQVPGEGLRQDAGGRCAAVRLVDQSPLEPRPCRNHSSEGLAPQRHPVPGEGGLVSGRAGRRRGSGKPRCTSCRSSMSFFSAPHSPPSGCGQWLSGEPLSPPKAALSSRILQLREARVGRGDRL